MFKLAIWLVFIFSVSFAYRVKRDANEGSVEKKNGETDALKEKTLFETVKNGTTEIINSLKMKMKFDNVDQNWIGYIFQKNADAGKINNTFTEITDSEEPKKKDVELSLTNLQSSVLEDVYFYVYAICPAELKTLQGDLDDSKKEHKPYAVLYKQVNSGLDKIISSLLQKKKEVSEIFVKFLGNSKIRNMVNEGMRVLVTDLIALEYDIYEIEKTASTLEINQNKLSKEQSDYLGVPLEGPYKPDHYRY